MSEFVYIMVTFCILLLTKVSSSSIPALRLRACIKAKGGHF